MYNEDCAHAYKKKQDSLRNNEATFGETRL